MSTTTTTTVHCRRCRASFELPSLSDTERVRIAEVVRAGQHIEAMRLLRQPSGIELRDAKGVEVHITRTPGVCQRCSGQLPSSGQTECPKCGSLNFDW